LGCAGDQEGPEMMQAALVCSEEKGRPRRPYKLKAKS